MLEQLLNFEYAALALNSSCGSNCWRGHNQDQLSHLREVFLGLYNRGRSGKLLLDQQ
jgi:hypothetical protein